MMEDIRQRTDLALQRHGISLLEHYVMCSVGQCPYRAPDDLVRYCEASVQGDPRGACDAAPCTSALAACETRGLVTTASAAMIRAWTEQLGLFPSVAPPLPEQGSLVLTHAGYALHNKVLVEIFGNSHADHSGWTVDEQRHSVTIIADSAARCRELVHELSGELPDYVGAEGARVVDVEEAIEIGMWWLDWYRTLPRGYSVTIHYQAPRPT